MPDSTILEYRQISSPATDIHQADAQLFFIVRQYGFAGSQRLQNQVTDFQSTTLDTFDDVLGRCNRSGHNMHTHFQADAAHAQRLAYIFLAVDNELLGQDV